MENFTPQGKQIVVLLSGGLDSTLAFLIAEKLGHKPIGLFVDLGQPYRNKEFKVIKNLRAQYPDQVKTLNMPIINADAGNVPSIDVEGKAQIIEGRNLILATAGAVYGDDLWICADLGTLHHGCMADKSYEFFETASKSLSVAFDKPVVVRSPVGDLTKRQLVKLGLESGITAQEISSTSTCYHPKLKRCGECLTCFQRCVAMRLNGIKERHTTEPLESEYATAHLLKIKDAWEHQDFSHYHQRRIVEVLQVYGLDTTTPLFPRERGDG